jgi:DNA invertase Pin-like site-specific DNA recombinase
MKKTTAIYARKETLPERRPACYGRTSTFKQDKGLEAQERALREWCKVNGYRDALEFKDSGISGMKMSRPELDRMMSEVRAGKIHTVIVYSFSRFARSTKHLLATLEELRKLGVKFKSMTENFDTDTPMGEAMFGIIAVIAKLERDLTAERVRNGLKNARAKGKKLGRPKTAGKKVAKVLELRATMEPNAIAEQLGISRASVYRMLKAGTSQKPTQKAT